jgi:hypothetical protein
MIAATYARKSTDQTGVADEQESVARQVEHARQYAERKPHSRHGFSAPAVLMDVDHTARAASGWRQGEWDWLESLFAPTITSRCVALFIISSRNPYFAAQPVWRYAASSQGR